MARTFTLAQMRTSVLDRADMDQTGPVTSGQVDDRINAAIATVYRAIKNVRGDEYFETETNFTTVSGTQSYALPSDFLCVSSGGVWWITGTGQNLRIGQYSPNDSELQLPNQGWTYYPYEAVAPVRYRIRAGNIRFVPIPLGTYTVRLKYIPGPAILVNAGDTFDGYQGFEQAVIWHAAASCKAKEESDATFELQMYDREMASLLESVDRDQNCPPVVQWFDTWPNEDC